MGLSVLYTMYCMSGIVFVLLFSLVLSDRFMQISLAWCSLVRGTSTFRQHYLSLRSCPCNFNVYPSNVKEKEKCRSSSVVGERTAYQTVLVAGSNHWCGKALSGMNSSPSP